MTTKRKPRADSAAAAIAAMKNAAKELLQPPEHVTLTEKAMKFWPGIVRARTRDEWIEADLVVAAQLAQCQADIEVESMELRVEGTVIENQRGSPVMNPRTTVLEQLARREMALMRTLRMGGRVAGDARDLSGKRLAERNAGKARAQVEQEEDDLLAS